MKRYTKILVCILMVVVYIGVTYSYLIDNERLEFVLNNKSYDYYEINAESFSALNDCVFTEQKELEITGGDPYIIVQVPLTQISYVTLELMEEYPRAYKVYYALDGCFTEEYTEMSVNGSRELYIGATVNTLRIDLENVSTGDKYILNEDVEIFLNHVDEETIREILNAIYFLAAYVLISVGYMIYLIIRKKTRETILVYLYTIVISLVWITGMSVQLETYIRGIMLLVVCLGMLFWGNSRTFEENYVQKNT